MTKNIPNHLNYHTMTLTGKGQVTAAPDIAVLRLGVQTTGENLADVQSENARISQNVLSALKQMGITDIKTYQYTIEKEYEYQNGNRIDKGYSVRNVFEIRTDKLGQVGTIIDTAVANGANIVDLISFEVSNPDFYYQQALNLAVTNAAQKAKSITMNMGILSDPIPVNITENSVMPVPFGQAVPFREGVAATPVEPGNKQINAFVTVEFIYHLPQYSRYFNETY